MNGAALRCHREALGLPVTTAATLLGTTTYKLQQWELHDHPVPSDVSHKLAIILAETIRMLDHVSTPADGPITIYRSNQALWAAYPRLRNKYPVQWHRVIAARAAAMTGRPIQFFDPTTVN